MRFRSFLADVMLWLLLTTAAPTFATVIDLGLPDGTDCAAGFSINNSGLVLLKAGINGNPNRNWLRTPDGTIVAPGIPPGFTYSAIHGINELGYAVGYVGNSTFSTVGVRSPDGIWSLPLPSTTGLGVAINNGGAIVGYTTQIGSPPRMFMYESGSGMTFIPGVGAPSYVPEPDALGPDITNQGVVVGTAHTSAGFRGFTFTSAGGTVLLSTQAPQAAEATDSNDGGVAVGAMGGFGSAVRAVKWLSPDTFEELGGLSSGFLAAYAINNRGDIVGSGLLGGPRAVLWSDDLGAHDLNDLLTPAERLHWELRIAYDINDNRQIVGMGWFDPDGPAGPEPSAIRGFLMTLPEPILATVPLFGLLLLMRSRPTSSLIATQDVPVRPCYL